MTQFTRRTALALLGAAGSFPSFYTAHAAGAEDRKFIFIILRGGMDGLAALIPDDSALEQLRRHTVVARSQRLNLGNGFRLHPNLSELYTLYQSGELAFVHAAATPYRERSHFDAQDALETLGTQPGNTGWLNRVIQAVGGSGLAVGYTVPLALRGGGDATHWSPPVFSEVSDDLLNRLESLYQGQPVLAEPLARARATEVDAMMTTRRRGRGGQYAAASKALAQLMRADNGPNIGMVSFDGWDTHANQAGTFGNRLNGLDAAIIALKNELGPDWHKTAIVACSEFGRTAAENGSRGTDHGMGGVVILTGGAIQGGQVFGDWPGLKPNALYQGRDVQPANDVIGILKGVLSGHLAIPKTILNSQIFTSSAGIMTGLTRS